MKIAATTIALVIFLLLVAALGVTSADILESLQMALNPDGYAYELNLDPDNNLIVSDYYEEEIWQINPATNVTTIYSGTHWATDAKVDSAGNIWWTGYDDNFVGHYAVDSDTVTEWYIDNAQWLFGLAIDDDDRIWVSDTSDPAIWRFDIASSELCTFTVDTMSDYILYDSGYLWMADWNSDSIVRLDTETNDYHRWELPSSEHFPSGMAIDEQNNLWWADTGLDALASLDPAISLLTTYTLPIDYSDPVMITTYDSGVWYSEAGLGTVGRLDPAIAVGITTTLTISSSSVIPVCGELGAGTSFSSSTTVSNTSWSGVDLTVLQDSDGWQIYQLPDAGSPYGITTLLGSIYVVDQENQQLISMTVKPTPEPEVYSYLPLLMKPVGS